MGRGFFIVLEGIDGSGKTTQAWLLAEALRLKGYEVVLTREPSDGPLGRWLRRYLAASPRRLSPELELAWFLADRCEHVANLIRPALEQGKIVISDRYYYSSAAYQGARGLDPEAIIVLNEAFAPRPDLVFLLELPVAEALRRRQQSAGVRQLSEAREYLERVQACYERFQGPHLVRLNAALPLQVLHCHVMSLSLTALERAGVSPVAGTWEESP
ncbi:MAG: dTMP kinase [Desulfobaccales bacterium]